MFTVLMLLVLYSPYVLKEFNVPNLPLRCASTVRAGRLHSSAKVGG